MSVASSSKPNFFGDSDDEPMNVEDVALKPQERTRTEVDPDDDEIEEISPNDLNMKSSSRLPSPGSSAEPFELDSDVEEDTKGDEVPRLLANGSIPASKKRKLSPDIESPSQVPYPMQPDLKGRNSMYLGETIITEAWATCSGKNLLKASDPIHVHLDVVEVREKKVKGPTTSREPSKQLKLTSMLKKPPLQKFSKKPVDDGKIVRFSNTRNQGEYSFESFLSFDLMLLQEVGRLPAKSSAWIARLLDKNAVRIEGNVIDCPEKLQTGCHIMLSLRFYFLPSAFIHPSKSMMFRAGRTSGKDWSLVPEGTETAEEKAITDRKSSLLGLFTAMSLKPENQTGARDVDAALAFAQEKRSEKPSMKGKEKEVIGEGEEAEEVEVEGEALTNDQLNAIYKK